MIMDFQVEFNNIHINHVPQNALITMIIKWLMSNNIA